MIFARGRMGSMDLIIVNVCTTVDNVSSQLRNASSDLYSISTLNLSITFWNVRNSLFSISTVNLSKQHGIYHNSCLI